MRKHLRLVFPILMLAAAVAAISAPNEILQKETTPGQAWDAGTRYDDWRQESTLTLINDCKKDHSFSVTKADADFLDFLFTSPVRVEGGHKPKVVNILFHTNGMSPGDYTGEVSVKCIDCHEVPPCTQDRTVFNPHIKVIARPVTTDNPVSAKPDDCQRDCNEFLQMISKIQQDITAQEAVVDEAKDHYYSFSEVVSQLKENLIAWEMAAWNNTDIKKAAGLQKAAEDAQTRYQGAIDELKELSQKWIEASNLLETWKAQEGTFYTFLAKCLMNNGFCKEEGPPKECTPDNPCIEGWTMCTPGQVCTPPEQCTPDHPCTGGTMVKGPLPVTKAKSTCSQTKDDCEQLRLLAVQKQAEARAAQETADAAAAEASKQEAAARQTGGLDPRDIEARIEVARSARENANTLQRAADNAKAAGEAALKDAQDCLKQLKDDCPQVPGQTTGNGNPGGPVRPPVTGGTTGTTSQQPCPPNPYNCEPLRLAWQEAERQAAIAQTLADEAARNQQWNNSEADYLDKQAASEEEFAKGQTERSKAEREIAGMAKGSAKKGREIALQFPAGSKDRASWEKAAEEDDKDVTKWNASADELEKTEMDYHMKAAADNAKAAQLRASSNSAQTNADAAKAAAAAAKQAYEDCLAQQKQYDEDCKRQAAAVPQTTGRGQTGGTPSGGTNPGGTQPGAGGGTRVTGGEQGGGTTTGRPPKIGTQGIPGSGSSLVDNLQTVESPICHWKTWALPVGAKIDTIYIRNTQNNLLRNSNVEAREGKAVSMTGQPTIEYHCMTDNGTAIVAYTYLINSEAHIGRLMVSCTQ